MPFDILLTEYRELGLVIATLIGIAFGFTLERAGFGNASKLAAQFYLYDLTVFKVMFSAIITAMAGLMIASGLGFADLKAISESAASFTYIGPMLVGGLALGMGFIISGYCPGTSLVASASGNLDGILAFSGVVVGSVVYGEIFPLVSGFHNATDKGHMFLYTLTGIPAPLLAAVIVAAAIAMFIGAEKLELFNKTKSAADKNLVAASERGRVPALATVAAFALIGVGTLALPGEAQPPAEKQIAAMDQKTLAKRILDEPWTVRVLDLRKVSSCAAKRVPGAECVPFDKVKNLGLPYTVGVRDLVIMGTEKLSHIPKDVLAYPGRVFELTGGFKGWQKFALSKPTLPPAGASEQRLAEYKFQASLHAAMTGMKAAPPPKATGAVVARPKKKKGGGCS